VCKPTKVNYHRIHSKPEKTSGTLMPTMTCAEIQAALDQIDEISFAPRGASLLIAQGTSMMLHPSRALSVDGVFSLPEIHVI
jgi:hypothetical protein